MIALHQSPFSDFAGVISSNTVSAQSQHRQLVNRVANDAAFLAAKGSTIETDETTLFAAGDNRRSSFGFHSYRHMPKRFCSTRTRRSRSRCAAGADQGERDAVPRTPARFHLQRSHRSHGRQLRERSKVAHVGHSGRIGLIRIQRACFEGACKEERPSLNNEQSGRSHRKCRAIRRDCSARDIRSESAAQVRLGSLGNTIGAPDRSDCVPSCW